MNKYKPSIGKVKRPKQATQPAARAVIARRRSKVVSHPAGHWILSDDEMSMAFVPAGEALADSILDDEGPDA